MQWMATCCPGLEGILQEEIQETMACEAFANRGQVYFTSTPTHLLTLRCADNLYAVLGTLQAGTHKADLQALATACESLPIREKVESLSCFGVLPTSLFVNASRAGRQTYSRFEAAQAVMPALAKAMGGSIGDAQEHTCGVRMDIVEHRATLSIKITPPTFRFRGMRQFSSAAVRPTIANALVRLTNPTKDDIFIDPFCGSGTLLAERSYFPFTKIMGGDCNPLAVAIAKTNAPQCIVATWDALSLPLESATVSAIATNPPWGKQIVLSDESRLYRGMMVEMKRACTKDARVVVLTDRHDALLDACQRVHASCSKEITLSLHGMLAGIYQIHL